MESNGTVSSTVNLEKFLCERLVDQSQPISERFRALFSLRNLKGPGPRNALILASRDSSNLLAHEAAFALGQMQDAEAIPALESVLNDMSLHPIVRHEAAEALGAIGLAGNVDILKKSLISDTAQEVRETCELALKRIEELGNVDAENQSTTTEKSPFMSVDPAGPAASFSSVHQLRQILLDETKCMYERYAALFALRNHGGEEAVSAIVDSLSANSALLRHEVAYVLGQLQNKTALATLSKVLRDVNEHPMVRHEAAEALGSIADEQSIALSMLEFENSGKSFEDAQGSSPFFKTFTNKQRNTNFSRSYFNNSLCTIIILLL
ncbi:PREDICTED: deoxyhypusine hydroxylase isoform X2 [Camelina sativa]|uniref:Deoxyhypusine hydroxylase n=1 Tax=Camelina sativa TaxID=90675 RepID=A0ABM1RTU2_CAMSA|nr:PREDICTED: deoxyhypusine hydroxylase isoform X2 [Camelina sativa]